MISNFVLDSLFVHLRPDTKPLETGHSLGDWKDELAEYGAEASAKMFIAIAPKTYMLRIFDNDGELRKSIIKCKGFSLNSQSVKALDNEETFRSVLCENTAIPLKQLQFAKNLPDRSICVRTMTKLFARTTSKRKVLADFTTEPYGTIHSK